MEKKESIATLKAETRVSIIAFSTDGKRIVSGLVDGSVSLWDMETQELVFTDKSHEDDVTAIAFSPDGSKFATGGGVFDNKVVLWDIASVIQKIEEQKKKCCRLVGARHKSGHIICGVFTCRKFTRLLFAGRHDPPLEY